MLIGAVCGGTAVLYVFYKAYVYRNLPIYWDLMDPDYMEVLYRTRADEEKQKGIIDKYK